MGDNKEFPARGNIISTDKETKLCDVIVKR